MTGGRNSGSQTNNRGSWTRRSWSWCLDCKSEWRYDDKLEASDYTCKCGGSFPRPQGARQQAAKAADPEVAKLMQYLKQHASFTDDLQSKFPALSALAPSQPEPDQDKRIADAASKVSRLKSAKDRQLAKSDNAQKAAEEAYNKLVTTTQELEQAKEELAALQRQAMAEASQGSTQHPELPFIGEHGLPDVPEVDAGSMDIDCSAEDLQKEVQELKNLKRDLEQQDEIFKQARAAMASYITRVRALSTKKREPDPGSQSAAKKRKAEEAASQAKKGGSQQPDETQGPDKEQADEERLRQLEEKAQADVKKLMEAAKAKQAQGQAAKGEPAE